MAREPIDEYVITGHASQAMRRRGLEERVVRRVLDAPEQRRAVREGREVLQSRVEMGGQMYLVRVFVDTDVQPAEVVTAYRTSKIEKYWSERDEGQLRPAD